MEENEIVYDDISLLENQEEVIVDEVEPIIEVTEIESYNIEMAEAFPALEGDMTYNHALLNNRELSDSHPIMAITGLREELDTIEALKTIYSDEHNVANYYKWNDAAYNEYGYFVSIVPGTSEIKICDGTDIFGVSVDKAGFIGGQDAKAPRERDNHYVLVATSGLVNVRCELEVKVGDHVVSNDKGYAKKSSSDYGYKVLALAENKTTGDTYAVISLGVQADTTNAISVGLQELEGRVDAAETNIVSAINVANQAYNKADEVVMSNKEMSDKVGGVLNEMNNVATIVEGMNTQIAQVQAVSVQARAIAESAVTSAESIKKEAVESANNAAAQVGELTKTLEPLTTWTDPETGNSGASYLANYIDNGLATKVEIETVEDDLEHAKSAISQNAKSLQSLVISIDKYSVGEYSTAHGLALDQATSILEPGIIYVPTIQHKEEYSYVDDEEIAKYEREFVPGYLYRWGELSNGLYGWITVDKYYSEDKLNTSAPSVYFSAEAPSVIGDFGYWYTNSDAVSEGYEPYTLYKWEEDNWVAVATLAGNVNNRSVSQIRQTANEIALEVTNARGSAATLGARITDTESEVRTLTAWTKDENGEQYNLATIKQTANEAGASVAQVVEAVGSDGKVNAASIITAVNNDTSGVVISANHINLKGAVTFESFDNDTKKQIEADTIDVQIWSNRGNIFKSRDVSSILTCHVFKAGVEITDTLPNSAFRWEKYNNDGILDESWTATPHGSNVNAIQISANDVFSRAVFKCAVEI